MAIQKKLYTIGDFEEFIALPGNSDRLFELIDGEIVEKMPTEEHSMIAGNLYSSLREFVKPRNLGRVVFEVRYAAAGDDNNMRLPDVSLTLVENLRPVVKKGPVGQLPDLAAEVQSPDESAVGLLRKATFYLENGVQVVLIVYPKYQRVEVFRSDMPTQILSNEDVLTLDGFLPGFSMPVKDIFEE